MTSWWAKCALLPGGLADDVRLEADAGGNLVAVVQGVAAGDAERLDGWVLPGMPNLHSHAFQRAMAGLAEHLGPGEASFWSWREVMYRFLERLTPDDVVAIAAQLYVEMLEAGYTAVGEFHYLHHAPDGRPYHDPAAMARAILEARRESGIGLTLLPVLYQAGGFGGQSPEAGQRRFLHDHDAFARLLETLERDLAGDPELRLGVAPHSLRAVTDDALLRLLVQIDAIDPHAPVHIHVAEQAREVHACQTCHGRRPVEHLLAIAPVDDRWCLIHCTHMDEGEVEALAASGAVAGLCPTTEANLGDGLFPLAAFLEAGGRLGIGSDSHVSVSPVEELRWLEYGQRTSSLRRVVAASLGQPHAGARLWRAALAGGAQALGRPIGALAPGRRADLVVLDADHPLLCSRAGDTVLDSLVFSGNVNLVREVLIGGRRVVQDGCHRAREPIAQRYRETLARLAA